MLKYAVIEFLDDNSVEVVPSRWIVDETDSEHLYCYYPTTGATRRAKRDEHADVDLWPKYAIRIFTCADTYEKGRKKAQRAEETSNMESSDCNGGRNRRKRTFADSDTESDNDTRVKTSKAVKVAVTPNTCLPQPPVFAARKSASNQSNSNMSPNVDAVDDVGHGISSCSDVSAVAVQPDCTASSDQLLTSVSQSAPLNQTVSGQVVELLQTPSAAPSQPRMPARISSATSSSANRVIISLLAEIKSELSDVKKGIATNTQMLQSLSTGSTCEVEDLGITLPLQNFQALDEMEEQLVHDDKFRKSLIAKLAARGGRNLKEITTRIMSSLLANKVVIGMNWSGQYGKKAFGSLKLAQVVTAAARRNRSTADATEADVQRMVVRFMHGAADREGGRCARQKRAHEASRQQRHAAVVNSDSE